MGYRHRSGDRLRRFVHAPTEHILAGRHVDAAEHADRRVIVAAGIVGGGDEVVHGTQPWFLLIDARRHGAKNVKMTLVSTVVVFHVTCRPGRRVGNERRRVSGFAAPA